MNARKQIETRRRTNGCGQATRPEALKAARGLEVRSAVRGGRIAANHNRSLAAVRGLRVRTAVAGGRLATNHSRSLRASA